MKNLKLKAARAAKDLSQQALADLVGVSDYGSDCMSGGISVFKENKKK